MGAKEDECFILVKAQPHRSSAYFETVCCAGIGRDGRWRRQYPIPYRILFDNQKFARWDWIAYEYTKPKEDKRSESQKVIPESLVVGNRIKDSERAPFLNPLIRESFADSDERQESLTLLRPRSLEIQWVEKSRSELESERAKHAELANQLPLFDKPARPIEPCPIQFAARWHDSNGIAHRHERDDWETSTAFNRFEKDYGREKALEIIRTKFESQYFQSGLVLAFSTHSRRNATYGMPNQWLLVGLIRLNDDKQQDLLLG